MEAAVQVSTQREKSYFTSSGARCAAWHYAGSNGACVVMASGGAVTKEPGTDRFAARFADAGFSVFAFDYRHLGESAGEPRQVVRVREQQADFAAALDAATALPEVDAARVAIWGFSLSGGHALPLAAGNPRVAAVIAQTPLLDGPAATRAALRHQSLGASLRTTGRALLDVAGGRVGRAPRLIPLAGERGTVAMLSTPDSLDSDRALNPDHRYPQWPQVIAARSTLAIGTYRPGRYAARVGCPMLVVVSDQDQSALPEPAVRAAAVAPRAELVRLPGGHYAPFLDAHEQTVDAELTFLRRHLLG